MFMLKKLVRAVGLFAVGLLVGTLLFLIGTPAFAQYPIHRPDPIRSVPGAPYPPDNGQVRLVIRADMLQVLGVDNREKVALTTAGIELSDGATIDFSPAMRGPSLGAPAGTVLIRVGGVPFVMPIYWLGPDREQP